MSFNDFTRRWRIHESTTPEIPPGTPVLVNGRSSPAKSNRATILFRTASGPTSLAATYDSAEDQLIGEGFYLLLEEPDHNVPGPIAGFETARHLAYHPDDSSKDANSHESESWVAEEDC